MKKSFSTPVLIALLLMLVLTIAPQAMALEMRVAQDGRVYFYADGVLGEDSDEDDADDDADENEDEDDDDQDDDQDDDDDQEDENDDDDEDDLTGIQPMRTLSPNQGRSIRIQSSRGLTQVELRQEDDDEDDDDFDSLEETDTERLRLQYPAGLTKRQIEAAKQRTMEELEEIKEQASSLSAEQRQRVEAAVEARKQQSEQYLEQIYQARQERQREMVELRTRVKDGEEEFELKSREIEARVKQGATFTLDPETNLVTVTTPSGQEHVLNHLPDQAISRMIEVGVISNSALVENTPEVEVGPTVDGQVVYRTRVQVKQKLFGLFNRPVETEVELDDTTGTVTQTELPSDTFFGQVLDVFTF